MRWTARLWPRQQTLWRRLAGGALWSVAGAGLVNAFTMAANVVTARLLGPTSFGELAVLISTANFFTTVTSAGLGMTASRYVAEYRTANPERAGRVMGMCSMVALVAGAVVALAIVLGSPWISRDLLRAPGLTDGVCLVAAILFFASVNAAQIGTLSGLESFRLVAIGNFVRGVTIFAMAAGGTVIGGLRGALLGYVGAGVATTVFYRLAIRKECTRNSLRISHRLNRDDWRMLWKFTLPVLATTFSFTPAAWWSNVLLARTCGYAEAGVFNAALHWQMVILFFSSAVSNIGLPTLSNVLAEGSAQKYRRCLAMNFALTFAPSVTVALPVIALAPYIMRLYGPAYAHGATAVALIGIGGLLQALNIVVGHAIWSLEATATGLLLAMLRGGTLVAAAYALVAHGATGLAGAHVIMGICQTIAAIPFMIWLMRRRFMQLTSVRMAAAA